MSAERVGVANTAEPFVQSDAELTAARANSGVTTSKPEIRRRRAWQPKFAN